MKDQVLSIEQMQKLKELGIYTNNASMCWIKEEGEEDSLTVNWGLLKHMIDFFETFTLQDIIELMPSYITVESNIYFLNIDKMRSKYESIDKDIICIENNKGMLINTYNVLVWLAKNKYI